MRLRGRKKSRMYAVPDFRPQMSPFVQEQIINSNCSESVLVQGLAKKSRHFGAIFNACVASFSNAVQLQHYDNLYAFGPGYPQNVLPPERGVLNR